MLKSILFPWRHESGLEHRFNVAWLEGKDTRNTIIPEIEDSETFGYKPPKVMRLQPEHRFIYGWNREGTAHKPL